MLLVSGQEMNRGREKLVVFCEALARLVTTVSHGEVNHFNTLQIKSINYSCDLNMRTMCNILIWVIKSKQDNDVKLESL